MASNPSIKSGPSSRGASASFVKAKGGSAVRATSSKGGHQPLPVKHCEAKRAASNVRQVY